jgi:hypothetical protein
VGSKILRRFTVFNLITIAMMAALGVAIKPIVVPLAHIITGPLYIPGGVVAGGFYMLWIVLGYGLVNKRGTATLIGVVQAILVIAIGFFGNQGIVSLVTYILPGISVDVLYMLLRSGVDSPINAFLGGMASNVAGTFLVSVLLFELPWVPMLLSLSAASLSGGIGGLVAYKLLAQLKKFDVISKAAE